MPMKRLFSLFLCFSMLPLSLLTGCSMSGSHSATEPSPTKPRHPDRLSDVTIITGNSDTEVYAGEQLKNYLEKKNVNCTNGAFRISVLIDESIVDDGYKIFTDENCKEGLSIVGGNGRGVLYGVYRFLEDYAGIRFFTPTLEVIPDDDILFDEINIEYIPVFTKRSMVPSRYIQHRLLFEQKEKGRHIQRGLVQPRRVKRYGNYGLGRGCTCWSCRHLKVRYLGAYHKNDIPGFGRPLVPRRSRRGDGSYVPLLP